MSVVVPLKTPIQINGVDVNELTFKEPDIGDLIAGEMVGKTQGPTAQVAATLASMAGVTYQEFKTIKAKDFMAIDKATTALMGNE